MRNGTIVPCGQFHDINLVENPENIIDDGFLTHDGKFISRDAASALINSHTPLQSEQVFDQEKKDK